MKVVYSVRFSEVRRPVYLGVELGEGGPGLMQCQSLAVTSGVTVRLEGGGIPPLPCAAGAWYVVL